MINRIIQNLIDFTKYFKLNPMTKTYYTNYVWVGAGGISTWSLD